MAAGVTQPTWAYGGYNPWTGNRWSGQVGASYNSRTRTLAAGQRAAVGNVYTGNYAYGGRGAAINTATGISGAAGRVTVGNAGSRNQATINHGVINNPNTGNTTKFGGIHTDQGYVGHVGDNVFGAKDGNVHGGPAFRGGFGGGGFRGGGFRRR